MKTLRKRQLARMGVPLLVAFGGVIIDFFFLTPLFSSRFTVDFPLLLILYFAFYEEETYAILPVVVLACLRDVIMGGPDGGFLFGSLTIYFIVRYLFKRLYVESELFLIIMVLGVFVVEAIAVYFVKSNVYEFRPPDFFLLWEVSRILVNAFVSIPLFYAIVDRVRRPVLVS